MIVAVRRLQKRWRAEETPLQMRFVDVQKAYSRSRPPHSPVGGAHSTRHTSRDGEYLSQANDGMRAGGVVQCRARPPQARCAVTPVAQYIFAAPNFVLPCIDADAGMLFNIAYLDEGRRLR